MRGILIVAGIACAVCFVITALIMLGASRVTREELQEMHRREVAERNERAWQERRALAERVRAHKRAEERLAALRNRKGGTPAA